MATARTNRARLHTLTALMAAAATLSACGGGDDAPPAPPPPPVAPAPPPPPVVSLPIVNSPPQGTTLDEGAITTLVVQANDGGGTLSYQWFLNDQPIAGATSDRIDTTPLPFLLSGSAALAYKVRVTNSAGSVDSAVATVATNGVTRSWQDVGNIDPVEANRQSSDDHTAVATSSGRVWVLGVVTDVSGAGSAGLMATAVSADNANDAAWTGPTSVPGFVSNGSIDNVAVAASASGHLLAVFTVYIDNPAQGEAASQVRAVLYTPNADPALPGRWDELGNLTDPAFRTDRAAVASTGPGEFEVVWLQEDDISERQDLIARRYTVPAAGQLLASGWGGREPVENNSTSVNGTPVIIGGLGKSLVIFYDTNGGFPRYLYNVRASGAAWNAAGVFNMDLIGPDRTRPVHAVNSAGMVALATRDASGGRAYTRRFDLASGNFVEGTWEYRTNAYGADPALLIDEAGRIDVFGVSVNTAAGNTSVLAHWTFDPAAGGGWGSANILVSDSGDYLAGAGVRDPQAGRDAAGNFVLAWSQPVNGTPALQSLRYSARRTALPARTVGLSRQRGRPRRAAGAGASPSPGCAAGRPAPGRRPRRSARGGGDARGLGRSAADAGDQRRDGTRTPARTARQRPAVGAQAAGRAGAARLAGGERRSALRRIGVLDSRSCIRSALTFLPTFGSRPTRRLERQTRKRD
jgi:hypothetical protein